MADNLYFYSYGFVAQNIHIFKIFTFLIFLYGWTHLLLMFCATKTYSFTMEDLLVCLLNFSKTIFCFQNKKHTFLKTFKEQFTFQNTKHLSKNKTLLKKQNMTLKKTFHT